MEIIFNLIILLFALFGFVCAVFLLFFWRILKEDSKMPTKAELYAAEKQRLENVTKD